LSRKEGKVVKKGGLLSISELARFARITRTALIHYDNMGLISPVERGENNYRYYSHHQITITNLISTFQELGFPLKEIMKLIKHRTPENIIALFTKQSKHIDENIEKHLSAQKLLLTLKGIMEEGLAAEENKIQVHWAEEESILLGPQIDYSTGLSIEEATHNFYEHCNSMNPDLDLNYPVWGYFTEERLKRGDWVGPDKFYFKMPGGPDRKPSGLYMTGYTRGSYGKSDELYKRLMAYLGENGLEICGPAYEMYLLNEISMVRPEDYLMKISITVK
jgi:DNA-binding transcriptional MerR regulator